MPGLVPCKCGRAGHSIGAAGDWGLRLHLGRLPCCRPARPDFLMRAQTGNGLGRWKLAGQPSGVRPWRGSKFQFRRFPSAARKLCGEYPRPRLGYSFELGIGGSELGWGPGICYALAFLGVDRRRAKLATQPTTLPVSLANHARNVYFSSDHLALPVVRQVDSFWMRLDQAGVHH